MAKLNRHKKDVPPENSKWKGGRKIKHDSELYKYLYAFRLNENDNLLFLQKFEQSNAKNISAFIYSCVFDRPIKVIKVDKNTLDVCVQLKEICNQIRAIGVNYNQITKVINTVFTEKKALAFMYKIEKETVNLSLLTRKVIEITAEISAEWLQK